VKMRILFDINHPADVHQFKHVIRILKKKHKVLIVARDKECVFELLMDNKFQFVPRKGYDGLLGKALGLVLTNLKLLRLSLRFKPDVMVGSSGDVYVAHVAKMINKPSLIFDDTEHSKLQNILCFPFATKIYSPDSYTLDLGKKHIRYPGYKEHAYLSARYFKPYNLKKDMGIKGKLILLRLVSWGASHDIGKKGIKDIPKMIDELNRLGTLVISSEEELPDKYRKYALPDKYVKKIHSLLYQSDLVVSEGGTLAVESAVLGTPTIYVNDLTMGYVEDLKKRKRIHHILKDSKILSKSRLLIQTKKKKPFEIEFDINKFMVDEILKCKN